MKSLMSINYKFMSINPKDLVSMIIESKYTKGVEVFIDVSKEEELKYLDNLVFELKRNNLILQVHGNIELDYESQVMFIRTLEEYSDYLGYLIVLTLHTISDDSKEVSVSKTVDYLSNLINDIDTNKIIISLENLNDIRGFIRPGKEEIRTTILNDEKIYFTYDIGHEIADFGEITNLDGYMFEDIRNVHIHSNKQGKDHYPIYKNDELSEKITKALLFLKLNKYEYNIVFEYGLEYCYGDTVENNIKYYLSSIDYLSEKIN